MNKDPASLLREHGLLVTAQRIAVLRAVSGRPHCAADQVAEAVGVAIGGISRQGVYDALRVLTDKGLIRRVQPAGSPGLYDPRVGDNHHHLVCRNCGSTTDIDCVVGEVPCLSAADSRHQIDGAEVIFHGTCAGCMAQGSGPAAS